MEPTPDPRPSVPTAPLLTADTRAVDKELGVSPPGAGGWTPKQVQTVLVSAAIAGLIALLDLGGADAITVKVALLAFGKGAAGYLTAYFGIRSAGVRKAQ